jgi:hypothetical protein
MHPWDILQIYCTLGAPQLAAASGFVVGLVGWL